MTDIETDTSPNNFAATAATAAVSLQLAEAGSLKNPAERLHCPPGVVLAFLREQKQGAGGGYDETLLPELAEAARLMAVEKNVSQTPELCASVARAVLGMDRDLPRRLENRDARGRLRAALSVAYPA